MSDSVLVAVMFIVLVVCATVVIVVWMVKHPQPLGPLDLVDDDDEPEPEPVKKALPINPENPPTWKYFLPRPGVEKVCHCHGRTLEHGEKVLWFPQIDPPGSVLLFCKDGVDE
jgi:hypothetical protein